MNKPIPAYNGQDSYVFVCYAHKDAESVYADLLDLDRNRINLWYDEGIPAGSSWRAEIAQAIQGASKLIFFISEASLKSNHCLREVDFALHHEIQIIPVYLQELILPPELALVLNRVQALYRQSDSRYMDHLVAALSENPVNMAPIPRNTESKFKFTVPAVLAILVLGSGLWLITQTEDISNNADTAQVPSTSANQPYLEALRLMERWDQDDNIEAAIKLYEQAIALDPNFALAYARLADAFRIRYALSGDEQYLDLALTNIEQGVRLNDAAAPVQVVLGRVYATQGKMDLAFVALERALAIDPNNATANAAMGRAFERQGRIDSAQLAYEKSLALDPEDLLNLDSFANFLYRQGRFEEAAQVWRRVVRLAPDHYAALTNLGASLAGSGETTEAIAMYQQAIAIRPTYMAWSNLGTTYEEAGRRDEAIDAFIRAIEVNSSDWLAWGNLAYSYSLKNGFDAQTIATYEQAILLAEESRESNPRDPYVHSDLSLYYAKTSESALALQRIETALALAPDVADIKAAAAEVYELDGQREQAVRYSKDAIELGYPASRFLQNSVMADVLNDTQFAN